LIKRFTERSSAATEDPTTNGEHGGAIKIKLRAPVVCTLRWIIWFKLTQSIPYLARSYPMCDNLNDTIEKLKSRNVSCTEIETAEWGITTSVKLPSGGEIGPYQPTHPATIDSSVV
jgi:hypothetical protein